MDVYCPRCGEPQDTYEFGEVYDGNWHLPRELVRKNFRKVGCAALDGLSRPTCKIRESERATFGGIALDLASDLDDVAADLDF